MQNNEIKYAQDYHEETKHSETRMQISRHYMDWDDRPKPFKVYANLPSTLLPDNFGTPSTDALECISSTFNNRPSGRLSLQVLCQLLFFSAGITRQMKVNTGEYYMRAASATGALYPIESYVVCQDLEESIPAGVYHFCAGEFSLTQIRPGDFRKVLAGAAGDNPEIQSSPATLIFTSLAWRNAWKYKARSYRHWFWDAGVIAANLLAVAASEGLKSKLVMGFADDTVNKLLFLEDRKEAAIVLSPIIDANAVAGDLNEVSFERAIDSVHTIPKSLPIAKNEVDYPEIWTLHKSSSLDSASDVREWIQSSNPIRNENDIRRVPPAITIETGALLSHQSSNSISIGQTILRRGSTRRFSHLPISKQNLLAILYNSTRGVPLDFLSREESLVEVYLYANDVEGLTSGRYFFNKQLTSLELLATLGIAACRNESGYLCLGQPLFGDASAVLFLMSDLNKALKRFGNRGYRACQFEAGVVSGKIYLCAYSLGLGASGSTFYDDPVAMSFSPHARSMATMIAVGIGIPDYKAKSGKVLAARLTKDQLLGK